MKQIIVIFLILFFGISTSTHAEKKLGEQKGGDTIGGPGTSDKINDSGSPRDSKGGGRIRNADGRDSDSSSRTPTAGTATAGASAPLPRIDGSILAQFLDQLTALAMELGKMNAGTFNTDGYTPEIIPLKGMDFALGGVAIALDNLSIGVALSNLRDINAELAKFEAEKMKPGEKAFVAVSFRNGEVTVQKIPSMDTPSISAPGTKTINTPITSPEVFYPWYKKPLMSKKRIDDDQRYLLNVQKERIDKVIATLEVKDKERLKAIKDAEEAAYIAGAPAREAAAKAAEKAAKTQRLKCTLKEC